MLLRFCTAGSVDDGKSTLIGRLLYDSELIAQDHLKALGETPDLSLLTDGLRAEREQKITIDVAYRYFEIGSRKFILADTPGHEQYTRNMITGACTADLVVLLLDARKGLTSQTRRHALICSLLGVPQIVLAVNKMDAVGYSQEVFDQLCGQFHHYCERLKIASIVSIPMSALLGDNIVVKAPTMPWYDGPTLAHHLQHVHLGSSLNQLDFRFPVQCVVRPDQDFRALAGRVQSGRIRTGQEITLLPSGLATRVKELHSASGPIEEAQAGQSILLVLQDELDAARGTMVVRTQNQTEMALSLEVNLCWTGDQPLRLNSPYWLLHTTRRVRCQIEHIHYQVNVDTLHRQPTDTLTLNQVGRVRLLSSEPICFDPYDRNRETGSLALADCDSHQTVAAGMIRGAGRAPTVPVPAVSATRKTVSRARREEAQGHSACVLWFTGPLATEVSDLCFALEEALFGEGYNTFSIEAESFSAQRECVPSIARVIDLAFEQGHIVIVAVGPAGALDTSLLREVVPAERFLEIFLDHPVGVSSFARPRAPEVTLLPQLTTSSIEQIRGLLCRKGILPT